MVNADAFRRGLELMEAHGLTPFVLPELSALRGIEQSHFHHLDVYDHTLAVLDAVALLQRDPADAGLDERVRDLLAEPLSDELTRGQAMRWAALLHDAAKPQTRDVLPNGRVTFMGHDVAGAQLARDVLGRMRASSRLRDYVAAMVTHHLDAGFLVHRRPLDRRTIWRYLRATQPYSADITVFTVADRLATRGPQRRAGDRGAPRGRARVARRRPRGGPSGHADPARARGRARARGGRARRAAPRRDPRPARGGPLRRGGLDARRGARPRAGAGGGVSTQRADGAGAGGATIAFGGQGVEAELIEIINAAYHLGEVGMWQPGWTRAGLDSVGEGHRRRGDGGRVAGRAAGRVCARPAARRRGGDVRDALGGARGARHRARARR